ncbi:hypothetical protein DEU56DRAFT_904778 [Suillus clintonianus]|uniref:uncharacterized protein n=1 Tax=Suillus clintonianus TaxID=1904413 RepID=UPI001B865157|nr:uncharacterized protein DEU56DRAFT_904778 [Suillus clintonianus]KAG2120132.1 hypothetical protein DEU56DRAFT_904778 [Suillus clintonianus]
MTAVVVAPLLHRGQLIHAMGVFKNHVMSLGMNSQRRLLISERAQICVQALPPGRVKLLALRQCLIAIASHSYMPRQTPPCASALQPYYIIRSKKKVDDIRAYIIHFAVTSLFAMKSKNGSVACLWCMVGDFKKCAQAREKEWDDSELLKIAWTPSALTTLEARVFEYSEECAPVKSRCASQRPRKGGKQNIG